MSTPDLTFEKESYNFGVINEQHRANARLVAGLLATLTTIVAGLSCWQIAVNVKNKESADEIKAQQESCMAVLETANKNSQEDKLAFETLQGACDAAKMSGTANTQNVVVFSVVLFITMCLFLTCLFTLMGSKDKQVGFDTPVSDLKLSTDNEVPFDTAPPPTN